MITKVYDAHGALVHDCVDAGCIVSWDGFIIDASAYSQQLQAAGIPVPAGMNIAAGKPAINQDTVPPMWDVSTPGIARLRS